MQTLELPLNAASTEEVEGRELAAQSNAQDGAEAATASNTQQMLREGPRVPTDPRAIYLQSEPHRHQTLLLHA